MLKTIFFNNTYFDERYAIKIFSDITSSEEKATNNINNRRKKMFSLKNNNFGEKVFRKRPPSRHQGHKIAI